MQCTQRRMNVVDQVQGLRQDHAVEGVRRNLVGDAEIPDKRGAGVARDSVQDVAPFDPVLAVAARVVVVAHL
jgi:hypothetical protein